MDTIKLNAAIIENVKRVRLVKLRPTDTGLTIIGGDNQQGKTSILDAILFALGGAKYAPTTIKNAEGMAEPYIRLDLSNGFVVERKGENATLKVTDPSGKAAGQRLLDEFVSVFALDIPKFMQMSNREKAEVLLQTMGIGAQLALLDKKADELYNQRHLIGQDADRKRKHAQELQEYPEVGLELVDATDIAREVTSAVQHNGRVNEARANIARHKNRLATVTREIETLTAQLNRLEKEEIEVKALIAETENAARGLEFRDEDTIKAKMGELEETNAKVRMNLAKQAAIEDADEYARRYEAKESELNAVRQERIDLLSSAQFPLEGLSVGKDDKGFPILTYNGMAWDGMSGMEKVRVSVAVARKLSPAFGFVLLDGLECFDRKQLEELQNWLVENDLQAIATRVSTGGECSIVIEDGRGEMPANDFI